MSQLPAKPELPRESPEASRRSASWWVVIPVVILVVLFAGGLIVLSMGAFAWVIALGLGLFLFAALHYLVWGWWLSGLIHREVAREDAERHLATGGPPVEDQS